MTTMFPDSGRFHNVDPYDHEACRKSDDELTVELLDQLVDSVNALNQNLENRQQPKATASDHFLSEAVEHLKSSKHSIFWQNVLLAVILVAIVIT